MKIELNYVKAPGEYSVTLDREALEIIERHFVSEIECALTEHTAESEAKGRAYLAEWANVRQIIEKGADNG